MQVVPSMGHIIRFYMYTTNEHTLPPYCFKQDGFLQIHIPCCPFAFCPLQHITQSIQATRSHNLTLSIPVVNTYIHNQSTVKVALVRDIKVTTNHNGAGEVI